MWKSLRRTLAVLLALAMLAGDNAVVFATESSDVIASDETAVLEEEVSESAGSEGEAPDEATSAETAALEETKGENTESESNGGTGDSAEDSSDAQTSSGIEEMEEKTEEETEGDVEEIEAVPETAEAKIVQAATDADSDTVTVEYDVTYYQTEARAMLDDVNTFRTGDDSWYWNEDNTEQVYCEGLSALDYDYELEAIAMQRAAEIVLRYAHYRPDGQKYDTAGSAYGITYIGENIALTGSTSASFAVGTAADRIFTSWLEEDEDSSGQGHRRNMLGVREDGSNIGYTRIGIACVSYGNVYFMVQEFSNGSVTAEATEANDSKTSVSVEVLNDSSYVTVNSSDFSYSPSSYDMLTNDTEGLPVVSGGISHTGKYSWNYWVEYIDVTIPADSVSWAIADTSVVKITEDNQLTAVAGGETTLTATVFGQTLEIPVTVIGAGSDVSLDVSLTDDSYTYDGTEKKPTPQVSCDGTVLTEGTDYTLTYSDNINAGTATVNVTGVGDYAGRYGEATFTIDAASISGCSISDLASITYTGDEQTPDVTIENSGTTLTVGTDYTVSYDNNTKAGTATVTIIGTGNYTGSTTKDFTIAPKTLTASISADGSITKTYDGTKDAPDGLSISLTGVVDGDSVSAEAGRYAYDSADAGTATTVTASNIALSGTDAGNYALSSTTVTAEAEISAADISAFSLSEITDVIYTGDPQTPDFSLTNGSTTLRAAIDYTIVYANNIDVGTAEVIVLGIKNYTGKLTGTFAINPADVSDLAVSLSTSSYTYDGGTKKPAVTVKNGETVLDSEDYTVEYSDNVNAGTATVTVTGKGNYTGTASVNFTIEKAPYETIEIQKTVLANKATAAVSVSLADYLLDGGTFGNAEITADDSGMINGNVDVTDGVLTFATSASEENSTATITVSVTGCTNYEDYSVQVIVTAKDIPVTIDGSISGYTEVELETVIAVTIDESSDVTFADALSGDWITNLPDGLTQSVTRVDDKSATITITGAATETCDTNFALTIPAEDLDGVEEALSVEGNAMKIEEAVYELSLMGMEPESGLAELTYGYEQGSTAVYTFQNTGNQTLIGISMPVHDSAIVADKTEIASLAPGESFTVSYTSVTGLTAAIYLPAIYVT